MHEPYKPGTVLLLPSGRTCSVMRVRGITYACMYESHVNGERKGQSPHAPDLILSRQFIAKHGKVLGCGA